MTVVPEWLDVAAKTRADALALTFEGQQWTFAELSGLAKAASRILDRHIERPLRVGILAANRPGYVVAVHAARHSGLELALLSWRLTPIEIAEQVRAASVGALVVDPERMTVAATVSESLSVRVLPVEEFESAPVAYLEAKAREINLHAAAAVLFTSGTGGKPKGARLSYGNLWHSTVASALNLGHQRDDSWLAILPLFHIGGLSILFRSVICGVPTHLQHGFDPERALRAIDQGASLVSVVPTMLQDLIAFRRDRPWPKTLRGLLLGGSAAPRHLLEECLSLGIPVAPTYGLTEAASQVATLRPSEVAEKLGSSGQPLPSTQVRIAGPKGNFALAEIGEIEIRGPTLFSGYLDSTTGSPERTADGWFRTGDAGYLDGEGYLYVVDRRDDLIVSGGENIYPAEVERVLLEHPGVLDAGVVGIEDDRWGQRPLAAIVWRGDPSTAAVAVREHCRTRLAPFKIPDRVVLVPELPRSPSGKLLRRELRRCVERQGSDG